MKYLLIIALVVVAGVAGGCSGGGTTTIVHHSTSSTSTGTTGVSATAPSTDETSLIESVIAKKPNLVAQLCRLRGAFGDDQIARLKFAQGYGAPEGGVSGFQFYDYTVEHYC